MAYNSSYTGPEIDSAIGAVKNKEKTWDSKQDKLNGTEDQLVGFNASGEAAAVPMPSAADVGADPAGKAEAEVVEHNSSGDAHSALFAEKQDKITGQQGQIVGFDNTGKPVAQNNTASGVTFSPGSTGMSADNVQAAVTELFTSVSDGKSAIAAAITDKGVDTAADATFQQMADNISNIPALQGPLKIPNNAYGFPSEAYPGELVISEPMHSQLLFIVDGNGVDVPTGYSTSLPNTRQTRAVYGNSYFYMPDSGVSKIE